MKRSGAIKSAESLLHRHVGYLSRFRASKSAFRTSCMFHPRATNAASWDVRFDGGTLAAAMYSSLVAMAPSRVSSVTRCEMTQGAFYFYYECRADGI